MNQGAFLRRVESKRGILVVHSSQEVRLTIQKALKKMRPDVRVVESDHLSDAKKRISMEAFELAFLDLSLPHDGAHRLVKEVKETAQRLKKSPAQIVALVNQGQESIARVELQSVFELVVPFTVEQVIEGLTPKLKNAA